MRSISINPNNVEGAPFVSSLKYWAASDECSDFVGVKSTDWSPFPVPAHTTQTIIQT